MEECLRLEEKHRKELVIQRNNSEDLVIALAGNPNVGKSTVFNALTGMKQHTGCLLLGANPPQTVTHILRKHFLNGI